MTTLSLFKVLLIVIIAELPSVTAMWSCAANSPDGGSPRRVIVTNTPVATDKRDCHELPLHQVPYNKLSSEAFAALGAHPIIEDLAARTASRAPSRDTPWPQSVGPPELSWTAKGVPFDVLKEKRNSFNDGCLVEGRIHLALNPPTTLDLEITRGAGTKDYLTVQPQAGVKSTRWQAKLRGTCRDVKVKVRTNSE